MGQDVQSSSYEKKDFDLFKSKMQEELDLLKTWQKNDVFSKRAPKIGLEIEGWFANESMLPSDCAPEFLKKLNHPQVVPELAKFNFEINSLPYDYTEDCFNKLKLELFDVWKKMLETAKSFNCTPVLVGTLPTLRHHMLSLDIMTPHNRYSVMNEQVMKFRDNRPLNIHIEGKDQLSLSMNSVISECAATSLQIHLGVTLENSAKYYNASLISSSFLIAVSANAPYLFGKELWDESRILGFEQSVDLECEAKDKDEPLARVTFGSGFLKESILELIDENVNDYPVILPEKYDSEPSELNHLKFHNGTIWRWTRPVMGMDDGVPALRIEQRVPSSGPTIMDSMANTVFFLGLVDYLASIEGPLVDSISFKDAQNNFYKAAKQSYYCKVTWIDGQDYDMQELLLETIIPNVKKQLEKRNIAKSDIDYYIGDIIYNRCKKAVNGAIWQKAYIHMHGKRFQEMMEAYARNQKQGLPVHMWSLDK